MSQKYIFQMAKLTKKIGQREVLKDIWLAFYPGAKIGVLGRNGSGKSTLLRIMAGKDKNFDGEARLTDGFTVGLLEQEPQLNPDKDVFGNVEEAVAPTRALLTEFEQLSEKLGEVTDPDEMEKLLERQAKVQDRIDACNAWELDRQVEVAMSAMNLPPGDARRKNALRRRESAASALCKILLEKPDLLLLDEPTNHLDAESVAWLERHLEEYPGTVVAVTHDRYFLDNVAKWILELDRGQGHPFEGNYTSWLEQKKRRLEVEEKQATARQQDARPRVGMGSRIAPRPGRPRARPASRRTRRWRPSNSRTGRKSWKSKFRPARDWATWSSRPSTSAKRTATG